MTDLKTQIAELRRLAAAPHTAGPYAADGPYIQTDGEASSWFMKALGLGISSLRDAEYAAAAMNAASPLADRVEELEAENARLKAEAPDAEDARAYDRLLGFAMECRGRSDVHSVHEVLAWQRDQILMLESENAGLRKRIEVVENSDDGGGPRFCGECGSLMRVIRPGSHECELCYLRAAVHLHKGGLLWQKEVAERIRDKEQKDRIAALEAELAKVRAQRRLAFVEGVGWWGGIKPEDLVEMRDVFYEAATRYPDAEGAK
jgi:hypothetical protein